MAKKSKPKRTVAVTGLVFANVLTGVYNPMIKYSLRFMPLYNFALLRHAVPAILVLPFAAKKWKKLKTRDLMLSIVCGLIMYVGANLFFYLGIERTSSINAAIILMLEPILLFVFSVELMRERFKKKVFLGIIIAFFGTALLVAGPAIGSRSLSTGNLVGNLFVLVTVACGVVSVWLMKYLSKRVPTFQVLFIGLAAAAVVYLVLALPTITQMSSLHNTGVLFGVVYGIIGVGVISYALRFWSLRTVGGQDYGLITYIEPALTSLVAFTVFHESFSSTTLAGAAIIFIGVWLAEVRGHGHWHLRSR